MNQRLYPKITKFLKSPFKEICLLSAKLAVLFSIQEFLKKTSPSSLYKSIILRKSEVERNVLVSICISTEKIV